MLDTDCNTELTDIPPPFSVAVLLPGPLVHVDPMLRVIHGYPLRDFKKTGNRSHLPLTWAVVRFVSTAVLGDSPTHFTLGNLYFLTLTVGDRSGAESRCGLDKRRIRGYLFSLRPIPVPGC